MDRFLDSPWAGWIVFLLFALAMPELFPIWLLCFGGYCTWKILVYLKRQFDIFCVDARVSFRRWREQCRQQEYAREMEREWERQRPIEEACQRAAAQAWRQREEARARCELFYDLHAPEIGTRFSREVFKDYLKRYLGDDRPADQVQLYAQRLLELLQAHVAKADPTSQRRSLEDLIRWRQDAQARIKALPLPREETESLLSQVDMEFDERIKRSL